MGVLSDNIFRVSKPTINEEVVNATRRMRSCAVRMEGLFLALGHADEHVDDAAVARTGPGIGSAI